MSSSESSKDLIKKTFETREGVYRISEYIEGQSRSNQSSQQAPGRQFSSQQTGANDSNSTAPVRISYSRLEQLQSDNEIVEHICFNHGRELHFMPFAVAKPNHTKSDQQQQQCDSETTKLYKGTIPTCHDVLVPNGQTAQALAQSIRHKTEQQQQQQQMQQQQQNGQQTASQSSNQQNHHHESIEPSNQIATSQQQQPRFFVLVGFGAGQVQLFEASRPQQYVFFNETRATELSRVQSIKWVPSSPSRFLVAHASGHVYLYDTSLPCDQQKPQFVQLKANTQSPNVLLFGNKQRAENPTHRLTVRTGAVNQLAFSNCGNYLALACQDGFLRVFRFNESLQLDLVVQVRSFFGGVTCVAWSPDGRFLATGGEDDLVTVVSFADNRVVCRGRGHRSWITALAFDPFAFGPSQQQAAGGAPYRLASVGQDTVLCLWELTEDVLVSSQQQLVQRQRLRSRSSLLISNAGNQPPPPLLSVLSPAGSSILQQQPRQPVMTVRPSATETLSIATSPSADYLVPLDAATTRNGGSRSPTQSVRGSTPSPSSTVGSTSGGGSSSLAGQLASKLAFWHRDKHKSGKSSSKRSNKEKRGSLATTSSSTMSSSTAGFVVENGGHHHQYQNHDDVTSSRVANGVSNGTLPRASSHLAAQSSAIAASVAMPVTAQSTSPPDSPDLLLRNSSGRHHPVPSSGSVLLLGTGACPRLNDVPLVEPLLAKKIAADPLSGVVFLKECLLTACQAGYLAVWNRPSPPIAIVNGSLNGASSLSHATANNGNDCSIQQQQQQQQQQQTLPLSGNTTAVTLQARQAFEKSQQQMPSLPTAAAVATVPLQQQQQQLNNRPEIVSNAFL